MLFVRRVDYKRHIRDSGKLETRISNEEDILTALQSWANEKPGAFAPSVCVRWLIDGLFNVGRRILNGVFHEMTIAQQLTMVQQSCVILGAHGYAPAVVWLCVSPLVICAVPRVRVCVCTGRAGLTHVLFARPGTQLVELRPPKYLRPHFIG